MFDNVLRQVKLIIYRLKRNFGVSIQLVRLSDITNNIRTGAMSQTKQTISIVRAIMTATRQLRDFVYDLAYIAANKNFTQGGYFDASDWTAIIDAKDLPRDFVPTLDDYIIYDGKKYNFKEVHPVAKKYAWLIILKQVEAIGV